MLLFVDRGNLGNTMAKGISPHPNQLKKVVQAILGWPTSYVPFYTCTVSVTAWRGQNTASYDWRFIWTYGLKLRYNNLIDVDCGSLVVHFLLPCPSSAPEPKNQTAINKSGGNATAGVYDQAHSNPIHDRVCLWKPMWRENSGQIDIVRWE